MSDTTSKPTMPSNFLADHTTLDDFLSWLRPKVMMVAAVDGNVIDAKTLSEGLHVFAMEVIVALDHHQANQTPWVGKGKTEEDRA